MKKRVFTFAIFMVFSFVLFLLGCGSNIEHIPTTTENVEKSRVYNNSFDKVWTAAIRVLSEDETFKILDNSGGIIVTESRTVDSKEMSLVRTYFLGKTYKNSYTLNFIKLNSKKTEIKINVKLIANQIVLLNRDESNEPVENYLRVNLFNKIAQNL